VRQYCVNWPIYNDDSFGNNVRVVMELCGGDVQAVEKARKEYAKYCNLQDSSEHREIELSGAVDVANLPHKPKSTKLQQAAENKADEWQLVRENLKIVWFGKKTPKSEAAIMERTLELMSVR
jgi:hypothetical protein